MNETFDVAIVGTGPSGVSAAFPLVERGLRVLVLDAGDHLRSELPAADYLTSRRNDPAQWRWLIGDDFFALRQGEKSSPKFRAPTLKNVFEGFARENMIEGSNFDVVGALSIGGLSNAWGCGVARFDDEDLKDFPLAPSDLAPSYEKVARRMGISGKSDDDLSELIGLDDWIQKPIALDQIHQSLFKRYQRKSKSLNMRGFRMGRSRTAVISEDTPERSACDRLGTCLWGCRRNAIYSSHIDLQRLTRHSRVTLRRNFVAVRLRSGDQGWTVEGHDRTSREPLIASARAIFLATGTLATTRLVLQTLGMTDRPVRLLSNAAAGFFVWFPTFFGIGPQKAFGLSQLSFSLEPSAHGPHAFGGLFSTSGLPVSEFLDHAPLARPFAIDLLRYILPSSVVGNVFLPGTYSNHSARLGSNGQLTVHGGFSDSANTALMEIRNRLQRAFRKLRGVLPAAGFLTGRPGSDVHYAGSIPMRASPQRGESDRFGEVCGLPGVFVVDGASLSTLPAKPHTLSLMANADRIGTAFAARRP